MTKEELEQEAEKKCVCTDESMRIMYRIGFIDGAEPREKHIEELETRCNELFFQVNEKIAKIDDLEEQIEKMKCCQNCKHCTESVSYKARDGKEKSKICSYGNYCCNKWEIKEK